MGTRVPEGLMGRRETWAMWDLWVHVDFQDRTGFRDSLDNRDIQENQ